MIAYAEKERARYWPVSKKLMAQYRDGSHTKKNSNGDLYWLKNDKIHRDEDKPAYIFPDGHLEWYQNDKLHRDGDKPAWIGASGGLSWWQNGQVHRFSGPAAIYPDGTPKWCWRGEKIPVNSQEEFIEWMKKHKGMQRFRVTGK